MSLGLVFWLIMLIWLLFGIALHVGWIAIGLGVIGGPLVIFILLAVLGWQVFGPPVHR
jgi:hypothetical protein